MAAPWPSVTCGRCWPAPEADEDQFTLTGRLPPHVRVPAAPGGGSLAVRVEADGPREQRDDASVLRRLHPGAGPAVGERSGPTGGKPLFCWQENAYRNQNRASVRKISG